MTRYLRPGRLIELESGLWAVDAVQPVAAVLDPETGDVRQVIGWPELPPPAPGEEQWPPPRVLGDGDGTALWAQQAPDGPLVRITPKGVETAAWTGGLHLTATGPGVAWCASAGPDQELVQGEDGVPADRPGPDRLLRVAASGETRTVHTENTVRSVHSTPEALLVEVDVEPWHLNDLGADTYEVEWETRWLRLPHDAEVPDVLALSTHEVRIGERPTEDDGGRFHGSWYDTDDEEPIRALGFDWYLGWSVGEDAGTPLWRRVVASANRDHEQVHGWDLGDGTVVAAATAAGRLVVAVARGASTPEEGVDLIALQPGAEDAETLLAADVLEIQDHGWPVGPRPLDADSYTRQLLAVQSQAVVSNDVAELRVELLGEWPLTRLAWTFSLPTHPGVRIRRQVRLFDELGRINPPLYADVHLAEDLVTKELPPADAAVDGLLDI
jgi:hypothetical protein